VGNPNVTGQPLGRAHEVPESHSRGGEQVVGDSNAAEQPAERAQEVSGNHSLGGEQQEQPAASFLPLEVS
jgi:hypothetical protein